MSLRRAAHLNVSQTDETRPQSQRSLGRRAWARAAAVHEEGAQTMYRISDETLRVNVFTGPSTVTGW